MGNYASKLLFYNENRKESTDPSAIAQQATVEDVSMNTPILFERKVLVDPRSVSAGIKRTPIEVKNTLVGVTKQAPSAIPKYLQKKQYLETNMDMVMPPLTPKKRFILKSVGSDQQSESDDAQDYSTPNANIIKNLKTVSSIDEERFIVLGLDPRSPAADFDRTPILMPRSLALIKARSQESLSRRGSYETDIYNPKDSCQGIEASLSIPKMELSSDTISKNLKILDITEKQEEIASTFQNDSDLSISKSETEITVIKNPKYANEKKKSLISDEQTAATGSEESKDETEKQDNDKIESNMKTKYDDKIELYDPSSGEEEESVSGKEDKKELPQEKISREDVIITFDECTTISTPLTKQIKIKTDNRRKEYTEEKRKKNAKTDVKLMLNEKIVVTPENKRGIEMRENRTPLGNRSNNSQIQKKPQECLRNKPASTRTQQENTPPYQMYVKTRNGNQWDPNSTIFI
ncbi:hypothetical protein P5V15_010995 [Pogonomyrmex californicus]